MRAIRCVGWGMVLACLVAARARGQARFEEPSAPVDVSHYRTVDECLALTERVADSLRKSAAVWRDTLPLEAMDYDAGPPALVRETARLCRRNLPDTTTSLDEFPLLMALDRQAGMEEQADTLVKRRLDLVPASAAGERAALVIDTIVPLYLRAPVRFTAAERLIDALGSSPAVSRATWMEALWKLVLAAQRMGDTARMMHYARRVVAVGNTLTEADRREKDLLVTLEGYLARAILNDRARLDSLRRSTASYVALLRADWAGASGAGQSSMAFPIGRQAPPIHGDFWFARGDSATPRPTKGKVALIVFLDAAGCVDARCEPGYAILRRLAHRFPALEITLVARTHGYVGPIAPPPPAEEADTLRRLWLDAHGLPGALAVTNTSFWRLPAPDRRRIDRDTDNATAYSFQRTWTVDNFTSFLVDPDGVIVEASTVLSKLVSPQTEERYARLIQTLLERQTAAR